MGRLSVLPGQKANDMPYFQVLKNVNTARSMAFDRSGRSDFLEEYQGKLSSPLFKIIYLGKKGFIALHCVS